MIKKEICEKVINECLKTGADFAELFVEKSILKRIKLNDEKIQEITDSSSFGVGIRICLKKETVYGYINGTDYNEMIALVERLRTAFNDGVKVKNIELKEVEYKNKHKILERFDMVSLSRKVKLIKFANEIAKKGNELINQVDVLLMEETQNILIANSYGKYIEDERNYLSFNVVAYGKKKDKVERAFERVRVNGGYELIGEEEIEKVSKAAAKEALELLNAGYFEGGTVPVIIGNGWGGVIIHEACGHALEAQSLIKNETVFKNKLNKRVGIPELNIIDDGTLKNYWGSTNIDDEGNFCQRNILVENGILKQFLTDERGAIELKTHNTGSCRRQSYKRAPISRMNNTYIEKGKNTLEEMIKSIDYGIYAKSISGGSVNPATGEFNFGVTSGNVIRNGKVCEPIKNASLIGNGAEILELISMIGNDLEFSTGYCGASSGTVPNCVGQPTIKVDKMIVGGRKDSDK